jgi:hypothetical protein
LLLVQNIFPAEVGITSVDNDPAHSNVVTAIGNDWAEFPLAPSLANFLGGGVVMSTTAGQALLTFGGTTVVLNDTNGVYDNYLSLRDALGPGTVKMRFAQQINRDSNIYTNWYTRAGADHKDVGSESGWHLNFHNSNSDDASCVNLFHIAAGSTTRDSLPLFSACGDKAFTFNSKPKFNGTGVDNNGSGLKHGRVTTGSVNATSDALVTLTWGTAFADTSYTASCSVLDSTAAVPALSVVHVEETAAANIKVRVSNTSAGALTGTLQCIAIHD